MRRRRKKAALTVFQRRELRKAADPRYGRRNPTKAERAVKAQKASVQRRVAVALAKFLKQANPGMKTAGAKITKLKGGAMRITPIKANAGRGVTIRKVPGGYDLFKGRELAGQAFTKAEALRKATQIRRGNYVSIPVKRGRR